MEYEISDHPQLGENRLLHTAAALIPNGPITPLVDPRRLERRDRAIAIPEQEAGS